MNAVNQLYNGQSARLIQAIAALCIGHLMLLLVIPCVLSDPKLTWILLAPTLFFLGLWNIAPAVGFAGLITAVMYVNWYTSIFSTGAQGRASVQLIQGWVTGFLMIAGFLSVLNLRKREFNSILDRKLLIYSFIIGVYFLWGLANGAESGSLNYLRMYMCAPFMLYIGRWVGRKGGEKYVFEIIVITILIAALISIIEYVMKGDYYDAISANVYYRLKYGSGGESANSMVGVSSRSFFNITGGDEWFEGLTSFRFLGPSMHPISAAYVVSFLVAMAAWGNRWILVFIGLLLLSISGSKGPLISGFLVSGGAIAARMGTPPLVVLRWSIALLAAILLVAVIHGNINGDYHVLGLKGSILGFFEQPWGRGLGIGGNLSLMSGGLDVSTWMRWRGQGHSDYGLESAWGVAFYQLGIFAFVVVWYWWHVVKSAITSDGRLLVPLPVLIGLIACLGNSVLQEEGMGVTGLGLMALLFGLTARSDQAPSETFQGKEVSW